VGVHKASKEYAMESRNPVFARAEGFNGRTSANAYTDPSQWGTGTPGQVTQVDQGRMTIDTVVQKTGITLGVVVLVAAATWFMTGDIETQAQLNTLYFISLAGAIGGFALAMVNSFKKVVSPGLVLVYALLQGVFVGAFSKALETAFVDPNNPAQGGLVVGAVAGTIAAVAGTLAAYKLFNIRVGARFYKWVIAAGMGFLAVTFLDVILGMFGNAIGFNGFGPLGLIMSVVGLGLGVLFLILDFDQVERGIAAGLPERESWRAAFGLTATIVFIYIEILRILAILRGN
jgi:uncharacterized YccA/Bax inhibitor family protein